MVSAFGITPGCAFISSYRAHARTACTQAHTTPYKHRDYQQSQAGGWGSRTAGWGAVLHASRMEL